MLWVPPGFAHGFLRAVRQRRLPLQDDRLLAPRARAHAAVERPGARHRVAARRRAGRSPRRTRQARRSRAPTPTRERCARDPASPAQPGQVGARARARAARRSGDGRRRRPRGRSTSRDADAIVASMRASRPALVVNARRLHRGRPGRDASATRAFAVNARAPGVLAEEAKRAGALLVHYSTDYVFDGTRDDAVRRGRADGSAVASTARASSRASARSRRRARDALVLRTSWVYGLRGKNFLLTMRGSRRERDELRVVDDQIGVPNWSRDARARDGAHRRAGLPCARRARGPLSPDAAAAQTTLVRLRARDPRATSPTVRVVPITTAEYPTPARRPHYGVLDTARFERTFGFALPDWRAALDECLASNPWPEPTPVGR